MLSACTYVCLCGLLLPLQEPSGREHITTNLNEFCKQHGLVAEKMDQVASGQQQAHKKWRVNVLSDGSSDESDSD